MAQPHPQQDMAYQAQFAGQQAQGQFRPLNVKDALSYLDQVKLQFSNQPDVYNQFLDIMKEFKSQAIDTPGVIQRVSTLFAGHRNLIQGFNTFLPPGYKIEDDMLHTLQPPLPQIQEHHPHFAAPPGSQILQMPTHYPQYPIQSYLPPPQPIQKAPVEFDHAINYVNKIKTRFQNQPEIYKSFLDILHIYQKEQKSIKEVYDQVAVLFRAHHDLLEEFTHFLPEAGVPHQQSMQNLASPHSNIGAAHPPPPSAPATAEHFTQPVSKKPMSTPSKVMPPPKQKRVDEIPKSGYPSQGPPTKKLKTGKTHTGGFPVPSAPPSVRDVGPELKIKQGNLEEIEYFDKVKKFLNNKHVYAEFLKCLNLFSQEIINRHELVHLMGTFLGKVPELLDWFKKFIGYKEPTPDEIPPLERIPVVDYSKCKRFGPSYRALPESFPHPKCTGRTDLCQEALNDVWVSFPIWSEDSPFLASKKNQFEEFIYRAEDERYELDRIIEVNATTIKTFEAVHKKLLGMSPEDAQKYRLNNTLGGTSEVIYHQAIKRIYGEKVEEVIDGLKRFPAVAIPVVLGRLRQKEEEWKKAQKEWCKIWGDIYAKNFHKSLDYQGINFRLNDKKTILQRTLVQEAELLLQEQKERDRDEDNRSRTAVHYEFTFQDYSLFGDIVHLITFYTDKAAGSSGAEKERLLNFLQIILRFFFVEMRSPPKVEEERQMDFEQNGISHENEPKRDHTVRDSKPSSRNVNTFIANGALFSLFRLLQFAYARLEKVRELAKKNPENPHRFGRINQKAKELNLQAPPLQNVPLDQLYPAAIEYLEQYLEAKQPDQNKFEDTIREMLGIDSYVIFTYDKLIHAISKQIQAVYQEEKSEQLLDLYIKEQERLAPLDCDLSLKEEASYKAKAEAIIGDEIFYKISFRRPTSQMVIQVLPKPSEAQATNAVEERWSRYVEQYVKMEPTTNVNPESKVFLRRNKRMLQQTKEDPSNLEIINNLECKICVNTYKMFFVEKSEDFFFRKQSHASQDSISKARSKKRAGLFSYLNGEKGWRRMSQGSPGAPGHGNENENGVGNENGNGNARENGNGSSSSSSSSSTGHGSGEANGTRSSSSDSQLEGASQARSKEELDHLEQECLNFFRGENGITQRIEVAGEDEASFCKYITINPEAKGEPLK